MFKGLGNIASLLKQAQNMGGQMGEITEELKAKQVVGTAGGGMINVTANGLGNILSVEIDQVLRDKGDLEMIQDLLPVAINDAVGKAKQLHVDAMQDVTGGISLPAGMQDMMKQLTGSLPGQPDDETKPDNDTSN